MSKSSFSTNISTTSRSLPNVSHRHHQHVQVTPMEKQGHTPSTSTGILGHNTNTNNSVLQSSSQMTPNFTSSSSPSLISATTMADNPDTSDAASVPFFFGGSKNPNPTSTPSCSNSFQFTPSSHPPATSAKNQQPFDQFGNMNDNNSNSLQSTRQKQHEQGGGGNNYENQEEETPYISVDGRRKRRRTTLDDAFRHLSIMEQQQQPFHLHPYNNNTTTTPNISDRNENSKTIYGASLSSLSFVTPCVSKKLNYDSTVTATATDPATFTTPSRGRDSQDNYRIRVDDFDVDADHDDMGGIILHSNLNYNHETSFCSLTSSVDDNIEDEDIHRDVLVDIDDGDDDDDNFQDNICTDNDVGEDCNDDAISSNSTEAPLATSNSSTAQSLLFAPRKDKNKHKTIIYNQHNNPVDDRIEELIRHSRLKAMIQLTREAESGSGISRESLRREQKRRNYEKMLSQNKVVQCMDNGCHTLRRKNSSSGLDSTVTGEDSSSTSTSSCSSVRRHRVCRFRRSNRVSSDSWSSSASPLNTNANAKKKVHGIQSSNMPHKLLSKGMANDDNAIGELRGRSRVRKGNNSRSRSLPREMKYPEIRTEKKLSNDIDMSS